MATKQDNPPLYWPEASKATTTLTDPTTHGTVVYVTDDNGMLLPQDDDPKNGYAPEHRVTLEQAGYVTTKPKSPIDLPVADVPEDPQSHL